MDNDTKFSILDLLDGRVFVVVLFSLFLGYLIIEPSMNTKRNLKERLKKLNEINVEEIIAKELDSFFVKTFYNKKSSYQKEKEIADSNKKILTKLNEELKNKNEAEINNLLNEIKYDNKKIIYLKGNINKIEKICKIYNMSFQDCNLIKWNDTYSEKLLNSNMKILEIN